MLLLIDDKPAINNLVMDADGKMPQKKCFGNVSIQGVSFAYPLRPSTLICKDFNLEIASGQTVALVGASGCGKVVRIKIQFRLKSV